jgi:hypothetical protein
MKHYQVRFNKTKGQPGRGTHEHVWRVFEDGQEYLVKHVKFNVPAYDETTADGYGNDDWNIACDGYMTIDKETSTAIINATKD